MISKQVILRLTTRCNFDCTFCLASKYSKTFNELSFEQIQEVLTTEKDITSVALEGGEPLMVRPDKLKRIIDFIDTELPHINDIGITTNLWDFYKRPEKWIDILKHPKLHVCTSFQYGNERRISKDLIFDEVLFRKVYNLFKEKVGKPLSFIAVIDETNEDSFLKTVELAKELCTTCKINRKIGVGRANASYPFEKMVELQTTLIELGLSDIEDNSLTLRELVAYKGIGDSTCPFVVGCNKHFVTVNPDGTKTFCSMVASKRDSTESPIKFYKDISKYENKNIVNEKCLTCRAYDICNNCAILHEELKEKNLDDYCNKILNCYDRIAKAS